MVLVNTLKIALVLGHASESVEDLGGTTNVAPDMKNVTVSLK